MGFSDMNRTLAAAYLHKVGSYQKPYVYPSCPGQQFARNLHCLLVRSTAVQSFTTGLQMLEKRRQERDLSIDLVPSFGESPAVL